MPTLAIIKDQFNDGTYFEGFIVYTSKPDHVVQLLKDYYADAQLNKWEEGHWNEDIPEDFQEKALENSITLTASGKERTYYKFEDFGAAIELVELTQSESEAITSKLGTCFGEWPGQ